MRLFDLAEVATVEKSTLSPWSISSLASECRITNGLSFVAVGSASRVLGWCGCRVIWPEAELLKIAVVPERRRLGVGRLLLEKVITELRRNAFNVLFLEVRAANLPALKLYRRNNFYQVGLRRNYYTNPPDSALVFRKDVQNPDETHHIEGLK